MSGTWAQWRRRVWIVRSLSGEARTWALRRYLEGAGQRQARLAALTVEEGGRVVFICHGNIMRSAFAAQVARTAHPQLAPRIVGGGTHAVLGRAAQDAALRVSRELQTPLDGHTATPMSALALTPRDLVVCMDAMNEANVLAAHPVLAHRIFRVGDIDAGNETVAHADREVRDPYGKGDESTRDAFVRIAQLAERWVTLLQRG